MPRITIPLIIFFILLLAGVGKLLYLNQYPSPEAQWRAVFDLKANHQLEESDLKKPGNDDLDLPLAEKLIGRYLLSEKKKGEEIKAEDVSENPRLAMAEQGFAAVLYLLNENEVATLEVVDAGSRIYLCAAKPKEQKTTAQPDPEKDSEHCLKNPMEVLAIHHKTSESPKDWVILKIPDGQKAEITALMTSEKRLLFFSPTGETGGANK